VKGRKVKGRKRGGDSKRRRNDKDSLFGNDFLCIFMRRRSFYEVFKRDKFSFFWRSLRGGLSTHTTQALATWPVSAPIPNANLLVLFKYA